MVVDMLSSVVTPTVLYFVGSWVFASDAFFAAGIPEGAVQWCYK